MQGIFLVIDEFAALRIALDTEFAEINDSLRRIILMGRVKHSHYHGVTTSGTSVLDGATEAAHEKRNPRLVPSCHGRRYR